MTVVAMLLASFVPLGIIMGPMMCGMYLIFFRHMRGQPVDFNMLFKGFDRFVESLIATLIQLGTIFLIMLPFIPLFFWIAMSFGQSVHSSPGNSPSLQTVLAMAAKMSLITMALTVVVTLVSMLFSFTYPLIIDRNLRGVEAVRMSFKAAWANIWGLVGLLGINMLLGLVGMLFCYVGVFFVLPLTFAALATAYRQVFGLAPSDIPPVHT